MKTIEMCPNCGLEVAFEESMRHAAICPRCENPVYPRFITSSASAPLTLVSRCGLQPIALACGTHTLGRKSAKSTATFQIDVPDLFMSKRHTQISVMEGIGGALRVTVRDAGSSNGTFVNERRLAPMEEVDLYTGDELRMGNTSFSVVMK